VLALVRKARRRILHNELLRQGANALSVLLAAFILLLVLGTQILSWYWALLLPLAAAGTALYRIRQRMPSLYVIAQRVDRRAGLVDALSTAFFFTSSERRRRVSPELLRLQLAHAEEASQTVDVRQAIPYTVPQTAYVAAALLLVATSVFALRYGLTDRLDLKQPLARILQQRLGIGSPDERARLDARKSAKDQLDRDLASDNGEQSAADNAANQPPQDSAENYAGDQSQPSAGKPDKNKKSDQSQMQPDSDQDQADEAEEASSDGKQNGGNPKDGQKSGKDSQSASNSESKSANDNQSLLSKMKEAMQNLLSSMKQPNQQQQNSPNQNGKSGKSQQNQGKQQAQKGDKKNAQSNESQEQQSADEGEQAQNAQGQSADKADSALANKQPGSGAGNKDGSKDLRQAEQLAAMGKISEIIGKRAANVTGEATVDVQNTSQQLRTSYQERQAEHTQTGAEINRDEIPVALEGYVQQYFEQLRKQPGKK
jgi:hypothetical protein